MLDLICDIISCSVFEATMQVNQCIW